MPQENRFTNGFSYILEGAKLLWHPKLRLYTLVPLIINCLLFVVLTGTLLSYLSGLFNDNYSLGWFEFARPVLSALKWVAWIILGALFIIVYGYSFNVITNFLAAPFYGLLAEAAENMLTGKAPTQEKLWHLIPRVLMRELSKLLYFLLRGLLVILVMVLVGFIPVVNFIAPVIGLFWGAWSMAIQYADYPADNNQIEFSELRNLLYIRMRSSLAFGGSVMFCSMIPIVNIIAMPAAVVGATHFWARELRDCRSLKKQAKP